MNERIDPPSELEALRLTASDARKKYIETRDMAQKALVNVFEELAVPQGEKSIFTIETEGIITAAATSSEYLGDLAQAWVPRRTGGIVVVNNRQEIGARITFKIGKDSKEPGRYDHFDGFHMYFRLDSDRPPEIASGISIYASIGKLLPQESHGWIGRNFADAFKREDQLTKFQFAAEFLARLTPLSVPVATTS